MPPGATGFVSSTTVQHHSPRALSSNGAPSIRQPSPFFSRICTRSSSTLVFDARSISTVIVRIITESVPTMERFREQAKIIQVFFDSWVFSHDLFALGYLPRLLLQIKVMQEVLVRTPP